MKLFLGLGRIGRLRYVLYHLFLLGLFILAVDIGFLVSSLEKSQPYIIGVMVSLAVLALKFDVQRLRDMGWTPAFLLLQVIPGVALLKLIMLLSVKGQEGQSLPAPPVGQKNAIIIGFLFFAILAFHIIVLLYLK